MEPSGASWCTSSVVRRLVTCAVVLLTAFVALQEATAGNGWRRLHRPLHLPQLAPGDTCPVSAVDPRIDWAAINIFGGSGIGRGPVYPATGPYSELTVGPDTQYGGPWLSTKVFWYIRPSYRGPVLIRGRQLDGTQMLGFNGTALPRREMHIHSYDTVGWVGQPPGSRGVPSVIRALVPGCYGVQIDGTRFSRVVIFRVTTG
jgi:hypothetical protein